MTTFVSISCFNDIDVIETVKSLKAQAARPDDLRIVVVLQTDEPEKFQGIDAEVHQFPLSWATGCGKPRTFAVEQLKDERYYLQLDCHMRFQLGWDETLLKELAECPDPEMAVLNTLPPGFVIKTGELLAMESYYSKLDQFRRNIPVGSFGVVPQDQPPLLIPLAAAGFMFCTATAIKLAPPDPFYHFDGEELSQSLRLWTHGYSIHAIRPCIVHHAYRDMNPRQGSDLNEDIRRHRISVQRIEALLNTAPLERLPEACLVELDKYGLGTVRSVNSWEETFGIFLASRTFR